MVNRLIHLALSGEALPVYGDGGQLRDYIYIDDAVQALLSLGEVAACDGQIYNVGSGVGTSLDELVSLVGTQVGRTASVERRPSRPFDVHRSVLNIARLQALMDFRPTPLEEGVRRTHAWLFPRAATVDRVG